MHARDLFGRKIELDTALFLVQQINCSIVKQFFSLIFLQLRESSPKYRERLEMSSEGKCKMSKIDDKKQPFPKTSAQMIGWRASKVSTHAYGIPESRARGKCDVLRVLQWPHEGL